MQDEEKEEEIKNEKKLREIEQQRKKGNFKMLE